MKIRINEISLTRRSQFRLKGNCCNATKKREMFSSECVASDAYKTRWLMFLETRGDVADTTENPHANIRQGGLLRTGTSLLILLAKIKV
jgi:hypothetical protein